MTQKSRAGQNWTKLVIGAGRETSRAKVVEAGNTHYVFCSSGAAWETELELAQSTKRSVTKDWRCVCRERTAEQACTQNNTRRAKDCYQC